jgi:hypothetical protein
MSMAGNTLTLTNGGTPVTLNFTVNGNLLKLNGTTVATLPDLTPAGSIIAFGGTTAPAGWLICDGSSYATTGQYAILYAAVGNAFGGIGGYFNVPDFRGVFLRGANGTRSDATADPDKNTRIASNTGGITGNNVGSLQDDAFQGHRHEVNIILNGQAGSNQFNPRSDLNSWYWDAGDIMRNAITDGTNGVPKVSSETRPKNVYVNYIIKY